MTELERRFAAEVLLNPASSAEAYRRAGGKSKNPDVRACQLLARPEVKAAIAKRQERLYEKYEITSERVLLELASMGYANMQDYVTINDKGEPQTNFSKITRKQFAAVQEITVDETGGSGDGERKAVQRTRFKLADKSRALELIGKHLKLYTDVVRHEGLEGLNDKIAEIRKRKSGS